MPRTPLMNLLQRAFSKAAKEQQRTSESRRRVLQASLLAGAGVALPSALTSCGKPRGILPGYAPRVVIIGAGIAGLNAVDTLRANGVYPTVYETSSRTGGRILTAHNALFPGTVTELGAELIDSDDTEILRLAREFHLDLLDLRAPQLHGSNETFFFEGRHYTEADIVREIAPVLEHISMEVQGAQGTHTDDGKAWYHDIDEMSIEAYFAHLGLTGWIRAFLESAYVSENGMELGEQSAVNFTSSVGLDLTNGLFSLYGSSDERYKIAGGNEQLAGHLTLRNDKHLKTGHLLEAVSHVGKVYTVTLRHGQRVFDVTADFLILALPFTLLREVHFDVPVPPAVSSMISDLRYGNNSKLLMAFERPFWHDYQANGILYADQPIQLAWDNTAMQGVAGGGLTFYTGGAMCRTLGNMTKEEDAAMLMKQLSKVWPSAADVPVKKVAHIYWPAMPWIKGSYSSFGPGQWTKYGGILQQGYLNNTLQFAGEHCSDEDRGFMNGAAVTGRQAAERILAAIA